LYTLLAGLVVASFTVTPTRRAPVSAPPTVEVEPAAARIAPMSRGLIRELRDIDGLELAAPLPTPEASSVPPSEVVPEATVEPTPEVGAQPEPQATVPPEPEPEATPDPTPEPTPRPT